MTSLAGTRALAVLALRLDRVRLAAWIVVIAVAVLGTASALSDLYPDIGSRQALATGLADNPGVLAFTGPAFDLLSIGGLTAWRTGSFGAVLVALMSLFTVVRHTRAEEEVGRLELVGAGVVGRRAPLTAALLVACGADLAIALLVALGLIAQGLPASGAVALGLAFAAAGWMFSAIAALAAQLTESARLATGMAAGVLGLSFLLRAVGDSAGGGASWLSWLSPIGWTQQLRPFAGERWWVLGLAVGFAAVLAAGAYALVARRDIDAGLLPPRLGPAEAPPSLRSPLALAWRLQRGALAGWTVGFVVLGGAIGAVAKGVGDLLKDNPQLEDIFNRLGGSGAIVDTYLASVMGTAGLVAAAYAVQATLRLRAEETGLRAEPVLATAVGRVQWALSHVGFAVLGPAVLLTAAGLAAGLVHGIRMDDVGGQLPRVLEGALVQLPATWVLAGLALALYGLAPQRAIASWAALVALLLIAQLGAILQLPQAILDLSPFTHVPNIPGGELTAAPILGLSAVAVALIVAGLAGLRRRDIG